MCICNINLRRLRICASKDTQDAAEFSSWCSTLRDFLISPSWVSALLTYLFRPGFKCEKFRERRVEPMANSASLFFSPLEYGHNVIPTASKSISSLSSEMSFIAFCTVTLMPVSDNLSMAVRVPLCSSQITAFKYPNTHNLCAYAINRTRPTKKKRKQPRQEETGWGVGVCVWWGEWVGDLGNATAHKASREANGHPNRITKKGASVQKILQINEFRFSSTISTIYQELASWRADLPTQSCSYGKMCCKFYTNALYKVCTWLMTLNYFCKWSSKAPNDKCSNKE